MVVCDSAVIRSTSRANRASSKLSSRSGPSWMTSTVRWMLSTCSSISSLQSSFLRCLRSSVILAFNSVCRVARAMASSSPAVCSLLRLWFCSAAAAMASLIASMAGFPRLRASVRLESCFNTGWRMMPSLAFSLWYIRRKAAKMRCSLILPLGQLLAFLSCLWQTHVTYPDLVTRLIYTVPHWPQTIFLASV